MPSVVIIGVGNAYRGDDGAGIAVVRLLRKCHLPGVTVMETAGEGTTLMEAWRTAEVVVLVDAVHSHARPGTIHRFDARQASLPAVLFRCSTHTFGVAEAVELARTLGWLPSVLIVYGIEAERYEAGAVLSPPVEHAVGTLAAQIAAEIGGVLRSTRHGAPEE